MNSMVIELHYLGSLEYFSLLIQRGKIELEVCDSFRKQTFRNRAYFLGSNKTLSLNVPLSYSNGTKTKDVKIDYSHKWVNEHWGAFYSSYGKAPFFEYFQDDFRAIWESKPTYLVDLNMKFLMLIFKILKANIEIDLTSSYQKDHEYDFRDIINPKSSFSDRKIHEPISYTQLFGDAFVPNLSIVDLVMNQGPISKQFLNS